MAASPHVIEVNDADFQAKVLDESHRRPVVVDFWAPWCGPCRAVAPEVAKVSARHASDVLVLKVNTDVDPTVGQRHGIQSIPTMALFRGGSEVARTSGSRPASAIEQWMTQALAR